MGIDKLFLSLRMLLKAPLKSFGNLLFLKWFNWRNKAEVCINPRYSSTQYIINCFDLVIRGRFLFLNIIHCILLQTLNPLNAFSILKGGKFHLFVGLCMYICGSVFIFNFSTHYLKLTISQSHIQFQTDKHISC